MEWTSCVLVPYYNISNDYSARDGVAFPFGSRLKAEVLESTEKPNKQRSMSGEESDNESSDESKLDL